MASIDYLSQIADYLQAQGLGYSVEQGSHPVDIFVGRQPDSPDNSISLWGQPGNQIPDVSIPDLSFPRFQVIVRNTDYEAGSAKLRAVRTALHDKIGWTLPNYYVFYTRAEQEGFPIGEDDKGRAEFSINIGSEVRYGDSI